MIHNNYLKSNEKYGKNKRLKELWKYLKRLFISKTHKNRGYILIVSFL